MDFRSFKYSRILYECFFVVGFKTFLKKYKGTRKGFVKNEFQEYEVFSNSFRMPYCEENFHVYTALVVI